MSILVKIKEMVDFGQNFQKDWSWSKFSKISILVKIWQNADFCPNIGNVDFSQNIKRTLVKIYKNIEFGQNVRKISIFIRVVGNSRFWSKLTKMSILDKIAKNVDYS